MEKPSAAMTALLAEYREGLIESARSLRVAIEDATTHADDCPRAMPAITMAHRIRGTAGTYGFMDISEAAARIEDALVMAHDPDLRTRQQAWSSVAQALGDLDRLIQDEACVA